MLVPWVVFDGMNPTAVFSRSTEDDARNGPSRDAENGMSTRWSCVILLGWVSTVSAVWAAPSLPGTQAIRTASGAAVQVEAGVLQVPESRRRTSNRRIGIP